MDSSLKVSIAGHTLHYPVPFAIFKYICSVPKHTLIANVHHKDVYLICVFSSGRCIFRVFSYLQNVSKMFSVLTKKPSFGPAFWSLRLTKMVFSRFQLVSQLVSQSDQLNQPEKLKKWSKPL